MQRSVFFAVFISLVSSSFSLIRAMDFDFCKRQAMMEQNKLAKSNFWEDDNEQDLPIEAYVGSDQTPVKKTKVVARVVSESAKKKLFSDHETTVATIEGQNGQQKKTFKKKPRAR